MSTAQTTETSPLLAQTRSDPAQRAQSKKIAAVQALRGVAALAVVAIHATAIERKYSGGDLLLPEWLRFGASGADLFFVISGFVMVTVTGGCFGRINEVLRFLWGRVTRIYPTYWFYFFITLAALLWQPSWVNNSLPQQVSLWASFLLLPTNTLPLMMVARHRAVVLFRVRNLAVLSGPGAVAVPVTQRPLSGPLSSLHHARGPATSPLRILFAFHLERTLRSMLRYHVTQVAS